MNSFAISALKGNRTLVWKNNLGVAEIDLEIGDKKVNLKVSPIQAALIYQFQVKEEWTAEQLSQEIKVTPTVIRRRMGFWVSQVHQHWHHFSFRPLGTSRTPELQAYRTAQCHLLNGALAVPCRHLNHDLQ